MPEPGRLLYLLVVPESQVRKIRGRNVANVDTVTVKMSFPGMAYLGYACTSVMLPISILLKNVAYACNFFTLTSVQVNPEFLKNNKNPSLVCYWLPFKIFAADFPFNACDNFLD